MYRSLSDRIREAANRIVRAFGEGDVYINIPEFKLPGAESAPQPGTLPVSLYDSKSRSERLKNKNDMRRQGPRPTPVDILKKDTRPVTLTVIGEPREDYEGKPPNNTTPGGRNEDRETIGFNPGEHPVEDQGFSREQRGMWQA